MQGARRLAGNASTAGGVAAAETARRQIVARSIAIKNRGGVKAKTNDLHSHEIGKENKHRQKFGAVHQFEAETITLLVMKYNLPALHHSYR